MNNRDAELITWIAVAVVFGSIYCLALMLYIFGKQALMFLAKFI